MPSQKSLRSGGRFSPKNLGTLSLWLDASAPNSLTTDDFGIVDVSAWSPSQLFNAYNCYGWYDAGNPANVYRQLSQNTQPRTHLLRDKATAGFIGDLQGVASLFKQYGPARTSFNGMDWLWFDTTADSQPLLVVSQLQSGFPRQFFMVYWPYSPYITGRYISITDGNAEELAIANDGGVGLGSSFGQTYTMGGTIPFAPGPQLLSVTIDSSGASSVRRNFNQNTVDTQFVAGPADNIFDMTLGGLENGTQRPAFLFGELIMFEEALPAVEQRRLERWLAVKWGITNVGPGTPIPEIATPVSRPTDINGCVAWWDASDLQTTSIDVLEQAEYVASGTLPSVTQWRDKANPAGPLVASNTTGSAPKMAFDALNGKGVLRFNGAQGLTGNFASAIPAGAYSVFAVCKLSGMVTNGRVFSVSANAPSGDFSSGAVIPCCVNASTTNQLSAFDGAGGTNRSAVSGFDSYAVFTGVLGSSSVTNSSNGARASSGSATYTLAPTRFGIGTPAQGGAGSLNGDIAEIVFYSRALSVTEAGRVEQYLALKWGIANVQQPTYSVGWWKDLSGNERHVTQGVAASKPTTASSALNGRRQISLVSQALRGPSTTWTGSATAYWVGRTNLTATTNNGAIVFNDGTADQTDAFQVGWMNTNGVGGWGNGWGAGNAPRAESPHGHRGADIIAGVTLSPSGSVARVNGATINTTSSLAGSLSQSTPAQFWIGRDTLNVWGNLNGTIAELLIYQPALSASQMRRVERYLSAKYGIATAPSVSNAEAANWIERVYQNGGSVSVATANAVDALCSSIAATPGLREAILRMNVFAGTGLNAALVPLYRTWGLYNGRNLVSAGDNMTAATWTKSNATVTTSSSERPFAYGPYANVVTATAGTGVTPHVNGVGVGGFGTVTYSAYLKANGQNIVRILPVATAGQLFPGNATVAFANIDLTTGAISNVLAGTSATATNVGNGWWRLAYTVTNNGTGQTSLRFDIGNGNPYNATGSESILIWGVQSEVGAVATDFDPYPLGNTIDLHNLFASTDYSESNGLQATASGSGATSKYLDSGTGIIAALPNAHSGHISACFKLLSTPDSTQQIVQTFSDNNASEVYLTQYRMSFNISAPTTLEHIVGGTQQVNRSVAVGQRHIVIANRPNQNSLSAFIGGGAELTNSSAISTSRTLLATARLGWFGNINGTGAVSPSFKHVLSSYSFGLALTNTQVTALNAALQAFNTAMGRT